MVAIIRCNGSVGATATLSLVCYKNASPDQLAGETFAFRRLKGKSNYLTKRLDFCKKNMFGLFKKKEEVKKPADTAVFTTKNVMKANLPITRVYHDKDGSWQFFDDISTNSNENIMIVGLGEIIKKDASIKKILNIPEGYFANRKNNLSEWAIEEFGE